VKRRLGTHFCTVLVAGVIVLSAAGVAAWTPSSVAGGLDEKQCTPMSNAASRMVE
jgi:hypothetical protein